MVRLGNNETRVSVLKSRIYCELGILGGLERPRIPIYTLGGDARAPTFLEGEPILVLVLFLIVGIRERREGVVRECDQAI